MPLSVDDFATQIKTKYPAYQNIDNKTLVQKVLAKYPTYQSQVDLTSLTGTMTTPPATTPTAQPKSVTGFLGNIVKSGAGLIGGIGSALLHPIKTVESLAGVVKGGVEKLIPGQQADEQSFNAMVDYFKNRYGGIENLKNTIYNDPVGFALDASVFLGGAGAAIGKVGKLAELPGVARAGEVISTAGKITDPLKAMGKVAAKAVKPVGLGAKYLTGLTTRKGATTIGEVYQAAKEGGAAQKAAVTGLRGGVTETEIVGKAKSALGNVQLQRATEYKNALDSIKKANPQSLDITPIINKQQELFDSFNIKVSPDGTLDLSRSPLINEERKVNAVYNLVKDYGTKTGDRTVTGIDVLKRNIRDFRGADNTLNSYLTQLGNSAGNLLKKEVPGYTEAMTKYREKSDLIESIQKDLSLGDKASIDRGFKTLTSAVKTDNELKMSLIKSLEESGAPNLMKQLAGANLSDWLPNDIFRVAIDITTIFGAFTGAISPFVALDVFTTSPRIVGELANALGMGARGATAMMEILKRAKALGIMKAGYYAQTPGQTLPANTITTPPQVNLP